MILSLELQYKLDKKKEKLQMAIVWKLPRWIIYWAVVRAFAHASTGKWGRRDPMELTYHEVLNRLEQDNGQK